MHACLKGAKATAVALCGGLWDVRYWRKADISELQISTQRTSVRREVVPRLGPKLAMLSASHGYRIAAMTRDQKIVAIGAASGVATMTVSMVGIYLFWPVDPRLTDVGSRIVYALQANAFAVLPLLIAVMVVGNDRFLSAAIDPTLGKENLTTQINGRVADNTLQQFVLFFVATMALSTSLHAETMRLIPAAAMVFVVARAAFWIGYRIHPLYRAFGMAATGYLNLGLVGLALWKAVAA